MMTYKLIVEKLKARKVGMEEIAQAVGCSSRSIWRYMENEKNAIAGLHDSLSDYFTEAQAFTAPIGNELDLFFNSVIRSEQYNEQS